jgi:hypothetical protein
VEAGNFLADLEAGDSGSNRLDLAATFASHHERKRSGLVRTMRASALIDVGEVEADGSLT